MTRTNVKINNQTITEEKVIHEPSKNRKDFSSENERYASLLDDWLRTKMLTVKESTYIRYRNTINNHIKTELGGYQIREINKSLIDEFVFKKLEFGKLDGSGGLSTKSVSDILVIIKETLKFAQSYGKSVTYNFEKIPFKKKPQEMRVLSIFEERQLLAFLLKDFDRYKLGVFLCLYTGMRIGEICALQWKDISLSENTIRVSQTMQRLQNIDNDAIKRTKIIITEPKSCASLRIIPLPKFVSKEIKPFKNSPDTFLLSNEYNSFVEPRTMQNRFKHYLKVCQIDNANFHSLRHTFATRCIESGFDAKTLSEILGHSSVKITLDKYVHSSMQLKRTNMEKLKMAKI